MLYIILYIYCNKRKEFKFQTIIISNPEEKEYKNVYEIQVLKIENIETKEKYSKKFNLLCNIKKGNFSLNYGDKIEFVSKYEVPSTSRNEGGFDYMQYLKIKKISGTVNAEEINIISKNEAPVIKTAIHNFKNNLIQKVTKILPKSTSGICIGLLLGDKSLISQEIQNNFKQSDFGLHIIRQYHISQIVIFITHVMIKSLHFTANGNSSFMNSFS